MGQAGFIFIFYYPKNSLGHFFFLFHRKIMRHPFLFILSISLYFDFDTMNKINEATFFIQV